MALVKKLLFTILILGICVNAFGAKQQYPAEGTLAFLGLDNTSAPTIIQDNRAANLQNIMLNLDGSAEKREGYDTVNDILDGPDAVDNFESITGGYELRTSGGTNYNLAICGSRFFYDNDGTWTRIYGATITEGQNYQFVWTTALDTAIATNNQDVPIKCAGTTQNNVVFTGLTDTITKAKCVIWWKNYLIWGNITSDRAHTTRIRWSNVGTIETYTDADYIDIATEGGQQIEGFGILYDNLYVFMGNSIYKVSLVGGDDVFVISKVAEGIGCVAKNSIQNITIQNTEHLTFLSRDGNIYTLSGIGVNEISLLIRGTTSGLKVSRLQYAVSGNDLADKHYYLSVTNTEAATTNNLLLDFYYEIGEWSKHTDTNANCMWTADDADGFPQIFFGSDNSLVYQLNYSGLYSDVYGLTGTFDDRDEIDTGQASGLQVLYDYELDNTTVLLMHFDGTNGSTNFVDQAKHSFTAYGDAQLDTSQVKFGSASGLFDGAMDYATSPSSTDWNLGAAGSGDFTIDFWLRLDTLHAPRIIATYDGSDGWILTYFYTTEKIALWDGSWTQVDVSPALVVDTWYHIAIVRSGSTITPYVNGTSQGAFGADKDMNNDGNVLSVGASEDGTSSLDGRIDELRIAKSAKWTANFTAPTSAYGNDGIVSLSVGATVKITAGTGIDESAIISSTTATGLVVTTDMTATGQSVYSIGAIEAEYVTKYIDMGQPTLRKSYLDLLLWAKKKSSITMDLRWGTDYLDDISTATLSSFDSDSIRGTSIDSDNAWSGDELTVFQIPLSTEGRFLKLKFSDTTIDEQMKLHSYNLLYKPLGID